VGRGSESKHGPVCGLRRDLGTIGGNAQVTLVKQLTILLMAIPLLMGSASGHLVQEAPDGARDRSAEPLLRSIFADYGARRKFKIVIASTSKEQHLGAFYAGSEVVLTYADGMRFRIVATEMWGSTLWISCDGRTLMRDPLVVGAPIELRNAPKSLIEADGRLQPGQTFGSPLFQLLQGPAAFDEAVESKGPITSRTVGSGWTVVSYPSKQLGHTELWLRSDDPQRLVRRIRYDNRVNLERLSRQNPDWFTMPEDPMTIQEISYLPVNEAILAEECIATPTPGMPVEDRRTPPSPTAPPR
jgi:hypothetical protein